MLNGSQSLYAALGSAASDWQWGERLERTTLSTVEALLGRASRTLGHLHERISTEAIMAEFQPRLDDVFIATYPRSGTTWLQMIMYQLVHGPSFDFAHINEVCPWFERGRVGGAPARQQLLSRFEQLPSPRIFKTHLPYSQMRNFPCRYVYAYRNGIDVARSNYYFVLHEEPDFASFFRRHFLSGRLHRDYGNWFTHVSGWLQNAERREVLYVRYEDMSHDLAGTMRRLAEFCGIALSEERLACLLPNCTFEAMKAHESKFDHLKASVPRSYAFLRNGGRSEEPTSLSSGDLEAYQRKLERHRLELF
jgi:hypothetical protein